MQAANAPPREVNTKAKAMVLYHCVYPEENFEQAAREIFDRLRTRSSSSQTRNVRSAWTSKVTELRPMPSMKTCSSYKKTSCLAS